jgi:hypothetical protein
VQRKQASQLRLFRDVENLHQWRKGIAAWKCDKTLYISVPFTWEMEKAIRIAEGKEPWKVDGSNKPVYHKGPFLIGGPGTMKQVECPAGFEPLLFHNPCATFTTRGCPNGCGFCAVPKLEGEFREIADFRPAPVVCDNNFTAASRNHQERVIEKLKAFSEVDFNQGLEAGRFTMELADLLGNLKCKVRFAFDHINLEAKVKTAIDICRNRATNNIGVYVLIGYNDTPEDARYRLDLVRSWKIRPNAMRFQPLDAKRKNEFIAPGWTDHELKRMMNYYNKLRWLEHIPYESFEYREREDNQLGLF